ncbi:MAG TPA: class I SAM-dependent methyltransferase [Desulfuromonadales bacterium]|nr:class I SAM-dependent methyltransferase [Desulfuromonadales bacterium]
MEHLHRIEENFHRTLNSIQATVNEGNSAWMNGCMGLLGDMLLFYRSNWNLSEDWAYEEMIKILKEPADLLIAAAMDCEQRLWSEAAAQFANAAALINTGSQYQIMAASYYRKNGNIKNAREVCLGLSMQQPENQGALCELFSCDVAERFWPLDYYELLAEIHHKSPPRVYIEIGVASGKSLALARSQTRSLGIDPATAAQEHLCYNSPENNPQLYKITSDDFFASRDVIKEMGRLHFDVAFIDGLHHFDQVLRDFINLEKYAGPDSIILIHDGLPINARVAVRDRSTWFWTGDVWKVIPCLLAVRPDLEIITLPFFPSGIALIRRLDPSSHILERQYDSLAQHFATLEFPDDWKERCTMLNVHMDQAAFNLADYLPSKGWS